MAAAMMPAFARAGVHVVAVASRESARARRFADVYDIPDAYGDPGQLLCRGDIDAVYVANATVDHAATAIVALQAGKAVLCEKPLALDAQGAARVAAAAREADRLCMEGLWTLFLPAYQRFIALANSEACGIPGHLCATFGSPEPATDRLLAPAAGGVLLDRGGYLIALALRVLGPVEWIDAQLEMSASGVDRHACLQISHSAGGRSQLALSFTTPLSNNARLSGPTGTIELSDPVLAAELVAVRRVRPPRPRPSLEPPDLRRKIMGRLRRIPFVRRLRRALPTAVTEHLPYGADPYLPEIQHFLGLLRSGARESDVVPLRFSLDIARVIDGARMDYRWRLFREGKICENRLSDELIPDDEHHLHPAGNRGARSARA
jgi:predicted dehydrogenase